MINQTQTTMKKRQITEMVRLEVSKSFGSDDASIVISELEAAELPQIANNVERVHLALIYLSRANLSTFRELLKEARSDWRDTLIGAGLAGENWRDVLRNRTSKGTEHQ